VSLNETENNYITTCSIPVYKLNGTNISIFRLVHNKRTVDNSLVFSVTPVSLIEDLIGFSRIIVMSSPITGHPKYIPVNILISSVSGIPAVLLDEFPWAAGALLPYLLISAGGIEGLATGLMWTAQGTYATTIAMDYHKLVGETMDKTR
jgi:hypothetical protein